MDTKEERIAKLELRIEIFENELRKLKNELAAIKGLDHKEYAEKNPIYGMSIENMNLSVRAYNCLKRAGLNTVGDILVLSEDDFRQVRNLGRKAYEEILARLKELFSDTSDFETMEVIKKKEEDNALNLEWSKKILPAFEVYVNIRTKAKEEGIRFYHISSGVFSELIRKDRAYVGYVHRSINSGSGVLQNSFCKECMDGKHHKMYKLLTTIEKEPDLELIKSAIIEDFTENNAVYNHGTKTYEEYLKFIKLIQEFKE